MPKPRRRRDIELFPRRGRSSRINKGPFPPPPLPAPYPRFAVIPDRESAMRRNGAGAQFKLRAFRRERAGA